MSGSPCPREPGHDQQHGETKCPREPGHGQQHWSALVASLVLRCRFVFVVGDLLQHFPTARLMLISLSLSVLILFRRCRLF
jgi:hypothetical protein